MKITKILITLFILLLVSSCCAQSKTDKDKLEILLPETVDMTMINTGQNAIIINKSNDIYIIDPFSFAVNVKVFENDKEMRPYRQKLFGSYGRDINDCKETILIIKPQEKITAKVFFFPLDHYDFSTDKSYILKSIVSYNKNTLTGCNKYINHLEYKGYKVPNIKLNTTTRLSLN
ncbi:hypothetical protein [Chryseobacterium arthrosphaerae]|uniref:hypothetical protein n=1 Tax=Chryseobacterium arthrosphaerae TaxID=651561 RepID=UPI00241C3D05|nr:hypothetical protein [Chryseobacterium arthrosphaerae]